MKGVVFTEFLTMVEDNFGLDTVDEIIELSREKGELPSGGAYTAVGTYDHKEIVSLVVNLSQKTETPVPALLFTFGKYLFNSLNKAYPSFAAKANDAFDFLETVETYIHVEVRKLYPDAELPTFKCKRPENSDELHMEYESSRHFEDLCEGLIAACLEAFHCEANIERRKLPSDNELFILKR